MAEQRFGIVMVGRLDGRTVVVAPYSEGRIADGQRVFHLAKGHPQTDDRRTNADAEFREETGIDAALLEYGANHPFRKGADGKDVFGGASVIRRIPLPPQQYLSNSGEKAELYLDVVVVNNIGALMPRLKGAGQGETPVAGQAEAQGLPPFGVLLEKMRQYGLPDTVQTADELDAHLKDPVVMQALRPGFEAIAAELEEKGLVNDSDGIKFDHRVRPLRYYREGALIMPVEDYAAAIHAHAENKAHYRRSMLGDGTVPGQLDAAMAAIAHVRPMLDTMTLEASGGRGR